MSVSAEDLQQLPSSWEGSRVLDLTDPPAHVDADGLDDLCADFVAAYNDRDLDEICTLVTADVEAPDVGASGVAEVADLIASLWERLPSTIMTAGWDGPAEEGAPCAVAWWPDGSGGWARLALVHLTARHGAISEIRVLDGPADLDDLEEPVASPPVGDLDELED